MKQRRQTSSCMQSGYLLSIHIPRGSYCQAKSLSLGFGDFFFLTPKELSCISKSIITFLHWWVIFDMTIKINMWV